MFRLVCTNCLSLKCLTISLNILEKSKGKKGKKYNITLYPRICAQLGQITIKTAPQLYHNWKIAFLIDLKIALRPQNN